MAGPARGREVITDADEAWSTDSLDRLNGDRRDAAAQRELAVSMCCSSMRPVTRTPSRVVIRRLAEKWIGRCRRRPAGRAASGHDRAVHGTRSSSIGRTDSGGGVIDEAITTPYIVTGDSIATADEIIVGER